MTLFNRQHIFTVQPVPAPCSQNELAKSSIKDGGNNQNEILLSLGNQFMLVISYQLGLCLHPTLNDLISFCQFILS